MNKQDWQEILYIDSPNFFTMMDHSKEWSTCAIGCKLQETFKLTEKQLSNINEKDELSTSLTNNAQSLGYAFDDAIQANDLVYARELFDEIQQLNIDELVEERKYFEEKIYG